MDSRRLRRRHPRDRGGIFRSAQTAAPAGRHRRAGGLCQNLGESTDELLQGLGSNAVEIERLRSLKAVA